MYPCILDMDQIHKLVLELKVEMTGSLEDNQRRALTHFECKIVDRQEK